MILSGLWRRGDNSALMSAVLIYEALTSGHDLFDSASKIADIASMETHLLNTPGWTTHCKRVASSIDPTDVRCASPASVLNYLYLSPSEHEAGCTAGFCATSIIPTGCGINVSYGTYRASRRFMTGGRADSPIRAAGTR